MALACAVGTAARAQPQVTLEPSAAARCLSPEAAARDGPEYPFVPFKLNVGGRVKVELEFGGPELRPTVKVVEREAAADHIDAFVDAVREHVQKLRVPCMRSGEAPVRLVQEYVFERERRRVLMSKPVDPEDVAREKLMHCVRHVSGDQAPSYPKQALRTAVQGVVVARLDFTAPDQPPRAEVYARPTMRLLSSSIHSWVDGYRMPCHQGGPVTGVWKFIFRFEGGAYGFKPVTLMQVMGLVRGIEKQTLRFDTTTMDCPFDLNFEYLRPYLPNGVGEFEPAARGASTGSPNRIVGALHSVPARQPLLQWLEGIEFDLEDRLLDNIFGDVTTITVPCAKIDLKPTE